VTEEAVTEEAVTEEAVTEEAVTEEAVTEEAVTEEAVTEEPVDQVDEELKESLGLLEQELEKSDCSAANDIADMLIREFAQEPASYRAKARSQICEGHYVSAWKHLKGFLERGGAAEEIEEDERTVAKEIARVKVKISPIGLEIPEDFDAGLQIDFPANSAHIKESDRTYRVAVGPGPNTFSIRHENPLVGLWREQIMFEKGEQKAVIIDPVIQLGDLVVLIEPADQAVDVTVFVKGVDTREELPSMGGARFGTRLSPGSHQLEVISTDPLALSLETVVEVKAGSEVTKTVTLTRLEPAELAVGLLDERWKLSVTLPTGIKKAVLAEQSLETGVGSASWAAELGGQEVVLEHSFDVPGGNSLLPLPSYAEARLNGESFASKTFIASGGESMDVLLQGTIPAAPSEEFQVMLPGVYPGEVRSLGLDLAAVPALVQHQALIDARSSKASSTKVAIGSSVATLALGGFAALSIKNAKSFADEAKAVSDSTDLASYQDFVEQANAAAGKVNIGMYSAIVSGGVAAGFTWKARSSAAAERVARSALDEAKATPYVLDIEVGADEPSAENQTK